MSIEATSKAEAISSLREASRHYIERQAFADEAKIFRDDTALIALRSGVSKNDIAIILGVGKETVNNSIKRAIKRIQDARRAAERNGR